MGAVARPSLPGLRSIPPWPVLRRRLLLAALLAVALAAGYHFWLRDSSLVAVEQVTVVGAEQSPEIDAKLRSAGLEQTTLHVDLSALREAVAADPAVRSVSATSDFPHGLTIEVGLRRPAGYLRSEGLVVAGDGVVLERTGKTPDGVPAIQVKGDGKAAAGAVTGEALNIARVLGAAPAPLVPLVAAATVEETIGVVVELSAGLELRFGGVGDADLKWRAAAAVLADPSFVTASYLDLSVPDRPVAGGVPDVAEEAAAIDPAAAEAASEVAAPEAVPAPEAVGTAPEVASGEPAPGPADPLE